MIFSAAWTWAQQREQLILLNQPPQQYHHREQRRAISSCPSPTYLHSAAATQWTSFWDLFEASVHSNSVLSDSQKLHYLKASLKGDAAKLLTSVLISDTNYPIARNILQNRYQNERAIVRAHVHTICSQPGLKAESAAGLRKLQETVDDNSLALDSLGIDTSQWDAILVYLVSEKLDTESRTQWELHSPGNSMQTYKDLRELIDLRSRALEASPKTQSSSAAVKSTESPRAENRREITRAGGQIYHAKQWQACTLCKSTDHRIFKCSMFDQMSVENRYAKIKELGLCFNCFSEGHRTKECPSKIACKTCNKRHHTMLHKTAAEQIKHGHHANQGGVQTVLSTIQIKA